MKLRIRRHNEKRRTRESTKMKTDGKRNVEKLELECEQKERKYEKGKCEDR